MVSGYRQCCAQKIPSNHFVWMSHESEPSWYLGIYEVTDGPVYVRVRFCPNCGAKLMPPLGA
jgi:hypothetical protein